MFDSSKLRLVGTTIDDRKMFHLLMGHPPNLVRRVDREASNFSIDSEPSEDCFLTRHDAKVIHDYKSYNPIIPYYTAVTLSYDADHAAPVEWLPEPLMPGGSIIHCVMMTQQGYRTVFHGNHVQWLCSIMPILFDQETARFALALKYIVRNVAPCFWDGCETIWTSQQESSKGEVVQ